MTSQNPPSIHNQPVLDPLEHFKAIPWCAAHLSSKAVLQVVVPDRTPIASTESALVRETLNTSSTVKACVSFLRYVKPEKGQDGKLLDVGEDPKDPFLQFCALVDLGSGVNGFAKTVHGGFFGVVLDEVMGNAANMQAAHGAFTVSLTVDFKRPLYTPQVVLVRGKCVKKEGKKLHMVGSFEDKDGNILADSKGLWLTADRDPGRTSVVKHKESSPGKEQSKL